MGIIEKIKSKPELKGLPDSLIEKTLNEYLSKNNIKDTTSEKSQKIIIKEVRSVLRKYVGQYASISSIKSRKELLEEGKIKELLNQHSSTRERQQDYPLIKEIIAKINPKTIIDLGCGINPIAIAQKGMKYHAYDINENDLHIVKDFFEASGIEGDIHHLDIRSTQVFPKADLCIIFKVLDILGKDRNEISKNLLEKIESKHFLVSFATRTLSGKPMNSPYRRWFENILKNLNLKYEIKRTSQELFYII